MKRSSWIVLCLALALVAFVGQMTASGQTTNAFYSLTSESSVTAGKKHLAETNSWDAVFLSDGTCSLSLVDSTNTVSGNYLVAKNGKSVTITPGAGGVKAVENEVISEIESADPSLTVTVSSVKLSKISLDKSGKPVLAGLAVNGKVSNGKKTKSFSLKTAWVDWTLVSGSNF
jgi:hypothetical protein